ncbi:MAG: beta-N-acetylglucosaminidase domain-containing protein [Rikenellaceae bacterium]
MKKILNLLPLCAAIMMFCSCECAAEQVEIYPTPQKVEWGSKTINISKGFNLVGANEADVDALRVLREGVSESSKGVKLIIGERGDEAVKEFEGQIPNHREGYFLAIKDGEVIIAGNDESGTFYGVQTFLQLTGAKKISEVTITDFPTVGERGMIEGYYGNPLSYDDRVSQFEFYGKNKMNTYIYGPKDDPYHGFSTQWREFYPEEQAAKLKSLVGEAAKNKVRFVWAVHPGNNINWNLEDSIATIKKLESVYDLGVRSFAVFFDDIGGIGTDPARQAAYLNYIQREFADKKHDVEPMIMCPTQYNQAWSSGDYLSILGTQMLPEIRIMWTGKSVCRMIDEETMEWINNQIKRKAYIWLNYPVTDYVIDHLLMGPFVGNEQTIASKLGGFVSNPMEYGEASKVALFSIADYAWNMEKFEPQSSWLTGMQRIMPNDYEAFKVFCENNIDLGTTYHALRMPNESAQFAEEAEAFWSDFEVTTYNKANSSALNKRFNSFIDAAAKLSVSTHNPNLITEITPWLQVFDIVAQKGNLVLGMHKALSEGDSVTFVESYVKIKELENTQKNIRSRDFKGSIKNPNPKAANEVVAPFIAKLQNELVKYYRANYTHGIDEFPRPVLEEGKYYIKINGEYLSNLRDSKAPTLRADEDNINPQRQEWIVTIDPGVERYKITNAQDNRFINELGKFSVNKFDASWNTFTITQRDGKYAIQNGGSGGNGFWNYGSEGIGTNRRPEFIFEFIPISGK